VAICLIITFFVSAHNGYACLRRGGHNQDILFFSVHLVGGLMLTLAWVRISLNGASRSRAPRSRTTILRYYIEEGKSVAG
jgi:hypothetical protein